MLKCYINALIYKFKSDGNIVAICKEGRHICPHYGGKCPALVEVHRGSQH